MDNADKPVYPSKRAYLEEREHVRFDGEVEMRETEVDALGLTKRERFAMAAMQGLISGFASDNRSDEWPNSGWPEHYDVVAAHSIRFADALLTQLHED